MQVVRPDTSFITIEPRETPSNVSTTGYKHRSRAPKSKAKQRTAVRHDEPTHPEILLRRPLREELEPLRHAVQVELAGGLVVHLEAVDTVVEVDVRLRRARQIWVADYSAPPSHQTYHHFVR